MSSFNPYEVLGIPRNATEEDVKKAYRKVSLKWHPDKNPGNLEEATQRFQEISRAKEILLDAEKRAEWDRLNPPSMFHFPASSGGSDPTSGFQQSQAPPQAKTGHRGGGKKHGVGQKSKASGGSVPQAHRDYSYGAPTGGFAQDHTPHRAHRDYSYGGPTGGFEQAQWVHRDYSSSGFRTPPREVYGFEFPLGSEFRKTRYSEENQREIARAIRDQEKTVIIGHKVLAGRHAGELHMHIINLETNVIINVSTLGRYTLVLI